MGWLSKLFGGGDDGDDVAPEAKDDATTGFETPSGEAVEPPESYRAAVLYPYPAEFASDELREMFERSGMVVEAIEAGSNDVFRVVTSERSYLLEQREAPYPRERMDRRLLPETFPDDFAHVGIAVDEAAEDAEARHEDADPWSEHGEMRRITQIVRGLLRNDGMAVVLEGADGLVVPSQDFEEMTQGADDPEQRPFFGWIGIRRDEMEDGDYLRSEGLGAFGLPEVFVRVDSERGDARWQLQREQEALLFAASRMVHANAPLEAGGELEVPFGADVGTRPVEFDEEDERTCFEVSEPEETEETEQTEKRLVLTAKGPSSVWASWETLADAEAEDVETTENTEMPLTAYQALFRFGARAAFEPELAGAMTVEHVEGMPELMYDVYQDDPNQPTLLVTNGLGRLPRGHGQRLEVALRTSNFSQEVLEILSMIATGIELGDAVFDPPDTVEFEEPVHGLQYFVLSPGPGVTPSESGPAVSVWRLVPLTPEEHADIEAKDDVEAWLDDHDGATGREFDERWNTVNRSS